MKKVFYFVLVLSAISCAKEKLNNADSGNDADTFSITADISSETKVTLQKDGQVYKMLWEASDKDKARLVYSGGASLAYKDALSSSTVSDGGNSATFRFQGEAPADYVLYYPKEQAAVAENSVSFTLKQSQAPLAASADPSSALLYAKSENDVVTFKHLAAYGCLRLSGLDAGESVGQIKIKMPGKMMNGVYNLDADAQVGGIAAGTWPDNVNLDMRCIEQAVADEAGCFNAWFETLPLELQEGDKINVQCYGADKVLRHEITLTASKTISFQTGVVSSIPVNFNYYNQKVTPDPGYTVTGKTYYVAYNGGWSKDGLSKANATTINRVLQDGFLKPGDQVRLLPGEYSNTTWTNIELKPQHSGTPGNYISFVADDPAHKPVLYVHENGWHGVCITSACYIAIDGLEVKGDNQNLTLADAEAYTYNGDRSKYTKDAVFNANGITVKRGDGTPSPSHHIIIRNCYVHDMPGSGIAVDNSDYVTVEYNDIRNCAWYTKYACSGISLLQSRNCDSDTDVTKYKMIVRGNKVFNCRTDIKWLSAVPPRYSDGNGIIIDKNTETNYAGRTLVENNISVHNGGSGIHSYKSAHVDIVNNTTYMNSHKYPDNSYAEIFAQSSKDVRIFNNIAYAKDGGYCNEWDDESSNTYSNNLYYNGDVKKWGTSDWQDNPEFVGASIDAETADFHLKATSKAIGHGTFALGYVPAWDFDFYKRVGAIDCGAYKYIVK